MFYSCLNQIEYLFFIGFLFQMFHAFSQNLQTLPVYTAGYKNIVLRDSSRTYKPNALLTHSLHFRPIEIDIWYPSISKNADAVSMKYVDFVTLLQERSNSFQNDTVYKNITSQLLKYIDANLQISDTLKLLQLKTNSYKNAATADKCFPLII